MTPAMPHARANRSVVERSRGRRSESARELHAWEVLCVWVGSALAGWMLIGVAIAGIWMVIT